MVGTWILREQMGSVWTLSWLEHRFCVNGWGRSGGYHGWDMDAARTDGVGLDVIMAGTWIPRERMGSVWTLSWLGHRFCVNGWGRSGRYHGWDMDAARTDGVGLDVIMAGTWILRERMGSVWGFCVKA